MILSALYISDHSYLAHNFELINFGSNYLYTAERIDQKVRIKRRVNHSYIPSFFDVSDSKVDIATISAIVGQNGVGKSTILDVIRRHFIENENALPSVTAFLIVESGEQITYCSREELIVEFWHGEKWIILERENIGTIQSIYYSPHLDLRFNPNFDEVDYFDISLDKYMELDLMDLEAREKNEYGTDYPVKQELLFHNSIRQINFLNSEIVLGRKVFDELFSLPTHGDAILIFRGTRFDEKMRNIPHQFSHGINMVNAKIEEELNNWTSVRKFDAKQKVINQLEVDRYLLMRNFLRQVISVVVRQMDQKNNYLSDGRFDTRGFEKEKGDDALGYFLAFLNNLSIKTSRSDERPFDSQLFKRLYQKILDVSGRVQEGREVKQFQLIVAPIDAKEILELQKQVVLEISNYYNKQFRKGSKDFDGLNFIVTNFIFYSPSRKKLSSGENALLNFFSKLYDFLDLRFNPAMRPRVYVKHFVLLLDEADAGFHPVWKKRFVTSLVKALPLFFEQFPIGTSIQIVFTTHDPLTLSDLPRANVICLKNDDGKVILIDADKSIATFGANITDLLSHSFFIDDGLIGDFAKAKIKNVIDWLNSDDLEQIEKFEKIIAIIDEPIVARKLAEMFDEKTQGNLQIAILGRQIDELERLRNKLSRK